MVVAGALLLFLPVTARLQLTDSLLGGTTTYSATCGNALSPRFAAGPCAQKTSMFLIIGAILLVLGAMATVGGLLRRRSTSIA
jgi:hypothetical protein